MPTWLRTFNGSLINLDFVHTIELENLNSEQIAVEVPPQAVVAYGATPARSIARFVLFQGSFRACADALAQLHQTLAGIEATDPSENTDLDDGGPF